MNIDSIRKNTRKMTAMLAACACLTGWLAMPFDAEAGACSKSKSSPSVTGTFNSIPNQSGPFVTEFSTTDLVCVQSTTVLSAMGYDTGNGNLSKNVQVCHIPQNEPEAQHTIIVDESAVPGLLSTGDILGLCPGWATESTVQALPGCSTPTSSGVWMPQVALANGASLNAYIKQVQAGSLSGKPDTSSRSYREIRGQ